LNNSVPENPHELDRVRRRTEQAFRFSTHPIRTSDSRDISTFPSGELNTNPDQSKNAAPALTSLRTCSTSIQVRAIFVMVRELFTRREQYGNIANLAFSIV
jgi:hypothetical protein